MPGQRSVATLRLGTGGHAVANKRVDFTYNAASQPTSTLRYASTSTAHPVAMTQNSYDQHGRLIYIDHTGIASGFGEAHGYDYDDANRLTRYTNLIDDILADYSYDNRDQLTGANHFNDAYDESYGYDNNGNRNAEGTQTNQIGSNNRLTNDGKYTYLYDAEGNRTWRTDMVTGDRTEYQWDHRNRLTLVTDYNANSTPWNTSDDTSRDIVWNYYDAQNQLIRHVYYAINGEIEQLLHTSFVYEDGQMVLRFDKDGQPGAADLSHRYLWGTAVDELLADEQVHDLFNSANNETLWALTDHLGSVRDVVDSNGDLRIHRNFDSFGNIVDETHYNASGTEVTQGQAGYVDEAFAFTGRYFDKDTGLQNNLNRWYDPTVGRWLSEDPIGFAAGDANLYRYVENQPTLFADPSGTATLGVGFGVAGYPFIGKIGYSADLNVRFWWIIPTDFSVTGTQEAGPGVAVGAGFDAHLTWSDAQDLSQLTGDAKELGLTTPLAGASAIDGTGYRAAQAGGGPGWSAGVYKVPTKTGEAFRLFFPWSPRAKWWFGLKNPFAR